MLKELKKRIAEEQTAKENMSIEEMRHEQQLVDYKLKKSRMIWVLKDFEARRLMKNMREIVILEFKNLSKILMNGVAKFEKRSKLTMKNSILCPQSNPALFAQEPVDSLIMEDEHLDTIPETESDEFIKSSVENLVQNPSESADLSDGESECDVPINDDSPESHFTTFSNPLFDSNDDFSSDDESLSEEEIQKDEFKYFSNPLYDLDDEIITNEKILPNPKGF
ncbi:hypothetical protein Tco_0924394 [Tanacetum coccineum]|uniref:Reverse transcriptase domain-containing protein n=1 Tax=Tanacetum coccineum TaxID=301880 RepID=A0ABQ5D3T2_9ASTR